PYAMAVIEEALRFFTVMPLSLPRVTVKDISYRNMFIPAGTTVVMNAYAANHDASVYPQPHEFRPERWLDDAGKIDKHVPGHFLFGAGSRHCSGNNLAIKEIYTMVCRTVLLFQVRGPADPACAMVLDPVEGNMCPSATAFEPRPFYVRLQPRRGDLMEQLHAYVYS
ncbi:cytochrome P450, partial [Metschnikowia bicuspidata]